MDDSIESEPPRLATGRELGVDFPTSIAALLDGGPAFLTTAFHASGALAHDNAVAAINAATEFFGGGMGRKLLLDVEYTRSDASLHQHLFVKFPRDFGDPLRELFTPIMAPEVHFALLSRRENFPIDVAKCYFADYDAAIPAGLLITERIAFGEGDIESALDKCLDYELDDPLPYYRELARAMGTLAGRHKAGALGDLEKNFPYVPTEDHGSRIPFGRDALPGKIAALREFARRNPTLLQDGLGDPAFLDRLAQEAEIAIGLEDAIRDELARDRDYVALCHWNMNIDNAWFRQDGDGLKAGLLDWGSVGQMNLAQAFFGMVCSAEIDFVNLHRAELLHLLVDTYRSTGGPAIDVARLDDLVQLSTALLGLAWIIDAPTVIAQHCPEYAQAADRRDPIIRDHFLARAQLQILNNFLNAWRTDGIGDTLRRFASARTERAETS
ncbi:hypothetical protein H5J25_02320 [Sphingomonas aliaeris]|uniref:Uncharacterized protein n=1 Tax=Sphingomonas aliaeris TaxID=2759526 RepID=A0A974NVH4_9SPHN|nr:hypothetical protein [Sphingomonas aliaeris]QQV77657.1 hypothetical protein H5J25_02320 [Sphingomonas aliaeris]